ncbi:MAG: hypothetical protein JO029_11420 [Candidatus Eremiobacteraeota bacterium]|nr:hypothetical protein [Candidatus Eremiobacteraeota bacterium]
MRRVAAVVLYAVLAGCAGTSAPFAPLAAPHGPSAVHSSTLREPRRRLVPATLRILIPRHRKRGHFLSPATQSIAVTVTQNGTARHFNFDLTPATNPHCTPQGCTIVLLLPSGSATFSFATYDGLLDGSGNPTGNELSANQSVPEKIVAGRPNTIGVTLDAIPASMLMLAPDGELTGSAANGFSISKCFTRIAVTVVALDADGNVIIGAGAPAASLLSSNPSLVAVASPSPSSPNAFTLTRPALPAAFTKLMFSASEKPAAGSGATELTENVDVAFNGDICGVRTQFTGLSGWGGAIAVGPDQALWVTEYHNATIARVTTGGTVNEYAIGGGAEPAGIAAGRDGNLWFTEDNTYSIANVSTSGSFAPPFATTTTFSRPTGMTAGVDGALWFTELNGNNIGRITTSFALSEVAIPTALSSPIGITAGPANSVWFVENAGNKIGQLPYSSSFITEYTIPTPSSQPLYIAAGPDGNLWFTECIVSKIGRMTPAGTFTEFALPPNRDPTGIASGPDGALWFVENGYIGRMSTAGVLTEIAVPNNGTSIVTGPDGALWYTEVNTGAVDRLQ